MKRFAFAAALLLALSAHANPCKDDAEKFCKDVKPGGGRVIACLKEHEADLSEGCRAMAKKAKDRAEDVSAHCKPDAEQLCKDVKPGGGRVLRCLRKHRAELSEACKDSLRPRRKHTLPVEKDDKT